MIGARQPAAPLLGPAELAAREQVDRAICGLAAALEPEELACPCLIAREVLETAEYPRAFPHLLFVVATLGLLDVPDANGEEPRGAGRLALAGWCLAPAVCYHVYSLLAGSRQRRPAAFTVRGRCFRHEAETAPGRRQHEFEMREIVLVGGAEWVEEEAQELRVALGELATAQGLAAAWESAEDPFFLPRAAGKAAMQRLLGTKQELRVPGGEALASINLHRRFFGERFAITGPDGLAAASACLAVGLDRWTCAVAAARRQEPDLGAVLERLRRCAPAAAPADLGLDTPIAELGLDSVGVVGFLVAVEEEFELDLGGLPLARIETIGDFGAWLASGLAAKEAAR